MIFLVLAAFVFVVALFGGAIFGLDMLMLGLLFLTLGHIFGDTWTPWRRS